MDSGPAARASTNYNAKAQAQGWPSFCDASLAFQRLELRTMLATWHCHAAGDRVPCRKEFTPRVLKSLLRNVVIYERVVNGSIRYRVRLMGTAFAEIMGELSGRYLDEVIPQAFLPRWYAALDAALEAGAPLRFISQADSVEKDYLVGEYFEAPILADDGSLSMVLAAGHFAPRKWSDVAEREASRPHREALMIPA